MTTPYDSVLIAYFSGTGNTRAAAELVAAELAAVGRKSRLVDMEQVPPREAWASHPAAPPGPAAGAGPAYHGDAARNLVVLFPVYSWAPPALVLRWVRRLPRPAAGATAAVLACDGGGGYGAAAHARRVLARRGWDVTVSMRAGFPENWTEMIPTDPPEEAPLRYAEGLTAARTLAGRVVTGERHHYRSPRGPAAVGSTIGVLFRLIGRRLLGQFFIADTRCTTCRICERTCPVRAIRIARRPDARPVWNVRCESCNRCINLCPETAIGTSPMRIALVTLTSVVLIIAAVRIAGAGIELWWPGAPAGVRVMLLAACGVAAQFLYFWTAAPLVTVIGRIPGIAPAFEWTFNASWRRYRAPGFKAPPRRE